MKKLFAILLVLAVVAGFVFASDTETHSLRIKSIVEGYLPVFQLAYTENNNDGAKATGETAVTNGDGKVVYYNTDSQATGPIETSYTAAYNDNDGDEDNTSLRVKDISQSDVEVAFSINLLNATQRIQAKQYGVVFTVGAFNVMRSGIAGTHGASVVTFTPVAKNYNTWTEATYSDGNNSAKTAGSTLTFNGLYNEESTSTVSLGSLAVKYTKDNTIDPNANTTAYTAGYFADITMEITAN